MDENITIPVVSIIMPVFNCADFVAEAIESILNQTFSNLELIIIDDNSTDKTKQIIQGYKDERISIILKEKNSGLIDSLNLGIIKARGQYIARMDGDDISDITRVQKQLNYLQEHPECILCGTACKIIENDLLIQFPTTHDEIKVTLLEHCPIIHPTVMLKSSFFVQKKLFYSEEFKWAEDYELWTRAIWLGQFANLPLPLLFYRTHANQVTRKYKEIQDLNSEICRINMLRHIWPNASQEDFNTRTLLFHDVQFRNYARFDSVIKWMDQLLTVNIQNKCFDFPAFDRYVSTQKKAAIRRFFLNETCYNLIGLFHFLQNLNRYRRYFSFTEQLKFGIKCLVFRVSK